MKIEVLRKAIVIGLIYSAISIMSFGHAIALSDIYFDGFNNLDLSKWTTITPDIWQTLNGTLYSTGDRPGLIFEKFDDTQYISEIYLTANDSRIQNYAQVGFYSYYKDSDNYGRVVFTDDNRGADHNDNTAIESKGLTFTNTQIYINTSTNTSIEFNPNVFYQLKVVRLNKNIYVYFDNNLALTTQFTDENPSGKVGFDVYSSTGYFRNFSLRSIEMKNASGYIDQLNLTSDNPTTQFGPYVLRLEDISSGSAMFSLSKFGRVVDSTAVSEGDRAYLNFENGDEGLEFKVTKAFNGSIGNRVELEDVISASSESLNPDITNLTLLRAYYQGANMTVNFSIKNPGSIRFNGTPTLTISSEGSTETLSPELDLGANQSKDFTVGLVAAKSPGVHKLTVSMKLDEYTTVTKSLDYQVRALNPIITTLSPDLREDGGIRGTVTIDSAYPNGLVDWNTTAKVEVFRVLENGKESVYSKEVPVKSRTFDIGISYNDFYKDSGRYLVTIQAGEMRNDRFFEIKGPSGVYNPTASKIIPPTVVSNYLYPQLMMLLIGMVAALSVRNHMHPRSWSLPLDFVAVICGGVILLAGALHNQTEIISKGMVLAGVGFGLQLAREHDSRIDALFLRGSPIHDFIGLILIFLSASYLIFLIPEWNLMLTVGALIVYYTAINLHGERMK